MTWNEAQSFIQLVIGVHAGYAAFSEPGKRVLDKNKRDLNKISALAYAMLKSCREGNKAGEAQSISMLLLSSLTPLVSKTNEHSRNLGKAIKYTRILSTLVCFIYTGLLIYSSYHAKDEISFATSLVVVIAGCAVATVAVAHQAHFSIIARYRLPKELAELRDIQLASLPSFEEASKRLGAQK